MYTLPIQDYLKRTRKLRNGFLNSAHTMNIFPILGYIDDVALVPNGIVNRELHEGERFLTKAVRLSGKELDAYSVVLAHVDRTTTTLTEEMWYGVSRTMHYALAPMAISELISIMTTRCPDDFSDINNITNDLLRHMELERVPHVFTRTIIMTFTSLAYDVIHIKGIQSMVNDNMMPEGQAHSVRLLHAEEFKDSITLI